MILKLRSLFVFGFILTLSALIQPPFVTATDGGPPGSCSPYDYPVSFDRYMSIELLPQAAPEQIDTLCQTIFKISTCDFPSTTTRLEEQAYLIKAFQRDFIQTTEELTPPQIDTFITLLKSGLQTRSKISSAKRYLALYPDCSFEDLGKLVHYYEFEISDFRKQFPSATCQDLATVIQSLEGTHPDSLSKFIRFHQIFPETTLAVALENKDLLEQIGDGFQWFTEARHFSISEIQQLRPYRKGIWEFARNYPQFQLDDLVRLNQRKVDFEWVSVLASDIPEITTEDLLILGVYDDLGFYHDWDRWTQVRHYFCPECTQEDHWSFNEKGVSLAKVRELLKIHGGNMTVVRGAASLYRLATAQKAKNQYKKELENRAREYEDSGLLVEAAWTHLRLRTEAGNAEADRLLTLVKKIMTRGWVKANPKPFTWKNKFEGKISFGDPDTQKVHTLSIKGRRIDFRDPWSRGDFGPVSKRLPDQGLRSELFADYLGRLMKLPYGRPAAVYDGPIESIAGPNDKFVLTYNIDASKEPLGEFFGANSADLNAFNYLLDDSNEHSIPLASSKFYKALISLPSLMAELERKLGNARSASYHNLEWRWTLSGKEYQTFKTRRESLLKQLEKLKSIADHCDGTLKSVFYLNDLEFEGDLIPRNEKEREKIEQIRWKPRSHRASPTFSGAAGPSSSQD